MSIRERLFGTGVAPQPAEVSQTRQPDDDAIDRTLERIDNALSPQVQEADVLVISGANCQPFPVASRSVREVRETLSYIMNIGPNATALVNGSVVPTEYVLQQGDTIEFTKEGGEKGALECKS
jgi:hypothetical protein